MSLIDEALKRARDESASQQPEGRRTPLPPRRGGRPPASGGGRILGIGLAAGILVSLLAYQAYRLFSRREPERPHPAAPVGGGVRSPLPEVFVAPPVSAPAGKAPSVAASASRGRAKPISRPEPAPAPAAASPKLSDSGDGQGRRPRDGESFSRSVTLPGGGRIELGGIVYSDTRPVALINGKVLAPGDTVEGFTIVKITPDRVELHDRETTISILAK